MKQPNLESSAERLKPPEGYASWTDYAIATMDTRSLHLSSIMDDDLWGRVVEREEMTEAAKAEAIDFSALQQEKQRLTTALIEKDELHDQRHVEARKVDLLSAENTQLREDVERLKKNYHVEVCQNLDADNIRLQAENAKLREDLQEALKPCYCWRGSVDGCQDGCRCDTAGK